MKTHTLLILMLCLTFNAWAYDFKVGGLCYNITSATPPYEVELTYETISFNSYSGSLTIPSVVSYSGNDYSVTSIGASAFKNCSGLSSIVIPSSVGSIGFRAFSYCTGLSSVVVPSAVSFIGSYAFNNCTSMTSVNIPDGVTSIDMYTFSNCSSLTTLTIPSSVNSLGTEAFSNCTGLTLLISKSTTPATIILATDVFFNINKTTCVLKVPANTKADYEAANQWKDFIKIEEEVSVVLSSLIKDEVSVYISNNELFVYGQLNNKILAIYDLQGNLFYRGIVVGDEFNLPLAQKGVCVVSIDNHTYKVLSR